MKVKINFHFLDNVNTLTVSIPKCEYKTFFARDLPVVLNEIKRVSKGGTFIPTEISESVAMPEEEFMMTLRDSRFIKHIPLNNWFTSCRGDVPAYCKKLTT